MRVALLGADLGTRGATDAHLLMRDGHHLLFVLFVLVVLIGDVDALTLVIEADQLQHTTRSHLEATTAADAGVFVDVLDELGLPGFTAGHRDGKSAHGCNSLGRFQNQALAAAAWALRASVKAAWASWQR